MQHLDEGTIHSWLDGALSPDEGARVEAHIAECAECRAKVAEARGFIAGASRILTALDDVPSGVVPIAQPARRLNRNLLRAAAVVLVVATGGLLVMRGSGNAPAASATRSAERVAAAVSQPASKVAAVAPLKTTPMPTPTPSSPPTNPAKSKQMSSTSPIPTSSVPTPTASLYGPRVISSAPSVVALSGKTVPTSAPPPPPMVATAVLPETTSGKPKARSLDTTIDFVLQPDVNRLQAVVTTGVTGASAFAAIPLKVVREDRIPGGRRTTYEIAPGKLVYLSEFDQPQSIPVDYRARPSIRWTGRSGKVMVLSGEFSIGELEQIRERIELQKK
jgi:hypothetical protein